MNRPTTGSWVLSVCLKIRARPCSCCSILVLPMVTPLSSMLSEFPQGTAPYEFQTQSRGNLSYMETISTWLAWLGLPERIKMCVCVWGGRALCVQMDFTRTFKANTKCNNMKYVWSHFYQILLVLKYHRRLWNNIFDTDIFRCIKTYIKGVYLAFFGIFMLLEMSVSKILFHRRLWCFRTNEIW